MNIMQSSEHNQPDRMEYHSQKVQQHCRVCGKLMVVGGKAASTIYKCQEFAQQLQNAFGITIDAEEDPTTFPSCFCSCCKRTLDKRITAAAQGVPQRCSTVTSNGATTVTRIAWYMYEKVLINVHVGMLTNLFTCRYVSILRS